MFAKVFLSIYNFFEKHRSVMWVVIIASTLVFGFFGFQVEYEEDMSKLLPQTEMASNSGIVFGNLKVKDKIFLQFTSNKGTTSAEDLTTFCDDFIDRLFVKDSATGYFANSLYRIEDDLAVNVLDYVLEHLPTLISTDKYAAFDTLLTPQSIEQYMEQNAQNLANDETGNLSELISQDPIGLRYAMLDDGKEILDGLGGYTMINKHFFSKDSTVEIAFLSPNIKSFDSKSCIKMIKILEENIEHFQQVNPDIEVLFHGSPIQSVFNSRQIKKDLLLTIGISLIIILLVICICFKNKSTLPFLLLPVVYGTLFALACMYWIKGGMSLMAIGIGAVVLGVALSYCLHVLTHYKYVDDPEIVIKEQAKPVCLGCLTTIGAFAGLLFTESDLLKDFGIFASLALIGTTLSALIFLPHFFKGRKNTHNEKSFKLLGKINDYPFHKKYWLLGFIVAISIVCFITSKNIQFDSNLQNIGYNEPKVIKSKTLFGEKNAPGFVSQYYAVHADNFEEALEYNKAIINTLDTLQKAGTINNFSKITTLFIPEEEQETRIETWKNYWTPEKIASLRKNINTAAQKNNLDPEFLSPFFDIISADYETGSLVEEEVLPEELLCNYMEFAEDSSIILFTSVSMPADNKAKVNDAIGHLPHAVVVDPFYYTNDMVKIVNNDFNVVLLISSIFVFIVLLLSLRSILASTISFLPMFLSWYIVQGIMAIFGLEFNLVNIIISSFIFGIGVDYSIFIMDGLLSQAKGDSNKLLNYHKTAILFSVFTLIVVVCSLLFAKHPAIYSVGISTIIGMVATVLISYTLQPALFHLVCRSEKLKKYMLRSKK